MAKSASGDANKELINKLTLVRGHSQNPGISTEAMIQMLAEVMLAMLGAPVDDSGDVDIPSEGGNA